MKQLQSTTVLIVLLALMASCKTQNILLQSPATAQAAVKQTDSLFTGNNSYEYQIRKDDKLSISIWNNDDISVGSVYGIYNSSEGYGKWLMVDKQGEISLPQIGKTKVEGLTTLQLKEFLTKELGKTILNPIIDVKVLNKEVTVLGEVKIPGKHLLEKENYTLLDVLGMAGDFDSYANKKNIQVIRMVNNQQKQMNINLVDIKDFAATNIAIQPGDIVYVPSKGGKEWDKRAGSTVVPLASAITTLIVVLKLFKF